MVSFPVQRDSFRCKGAKARLRRHGRRAHCRTRPEGVRFRSALGATTLDPMDVRPLARAAEAGRICGFLGRLLGLTPSPVAAAREVVPIRAGSPPWKQGYDLGQKARARLAPASQPVPSMQTLLEDLGVHVAFVRFASADVEAASVYEADAAPVMLVNVLSSRAAEPLPRRAALAHELCHLLHDGGERDLLTAVSRPEDHLDYEQRGPCASALGTARPFATATPRLASAIPTSRTTASPDVRTKWGEPPRAVTTAAAS